ncbi:MAG: radical SAM protein [Nanoarchaeota archaeon]|nr:radical SAM protein [Nanoarchaeota archaeon]MBU1622010.1 radical SAM protein [Nanoarchaeota archaeon]MBU1974551.1 radical SAM protein [Nanoarchaeota archaeon]
MKQCMFERAVFLSWYCSVGDCQFCYMSTQKDKIKDPKRAKRRLSSVLAEVLICRKLGWGLEFVSAGYGALEFNELLKYLEAIKKVWGKKIWLNIGFLDKEQIERLLPIVEGVSVSVETVNWKLRKKLCPSKPIEPMIRTLELCDRLGIKKAMTIVLGLGEMIKDFVELEKFVKEYKIEQITFYRLKPHQGTVFYGQKELVSDDYVTWVRKTREVFPDLKIVVGSWLDHLEEISLLLEAGADNITKFPALKMFGNKYAKKIQAEVMKAEREFKGSLVRLPKVNWEEEVNKLSISQDLKEHLQLKLKQYLKGMR